MLKSSIYIPLPWTHFLKRAYLRSFSGLTSLYSVNIQLNSKLHLPPPKFSGSAPTPHQAIYVVCVPVVIKRRSQLEHL